jgi:uncharacterized protein
MPLSEVDMQASARIAALVASYIVGVNYLDYDYFISVRANSTIIGGPSAGAAMTVALVAALLNAPLNKSVVVTGMINPDGTIGPVGGIPEKLEAAAEVGAKIMLVPAGQLITQDINGELVNMTELGSRYGIKVIEVSTIYDALYWFGINIKRPSPAQVDLSKSVKNVILGWIEDFNETVNEVRGELNDVLRRHPSLESWVRDYIIEADDYIMRGYESLQAGRYYSTSSDFFAAIINLDTARWIAKIRAGLSSLNDVVDYASEAVERANTTYDMIKSQISGDIDLSQLTVIVEVAERVYEANRYLHRIGEAADPGELIYIAIYAKWRAESAIDWAKMLDAIPLSGLLMSNDTVEEIVPLLVYYADSTTSYVEALTGYTFSDVMQAIEEAKNIMYDDPIKAFALAIRVVALTTATINSAFSVDIKKTVNILREESRRAVAEAIERGLDPAVAIAYIERGDSMIGVDNDSAVYFYELSLINTMGYLTMTKSVKKTGTVSWAPITNPKVPHNIYPSFGRMTDVLIAVSILAVSAVLVLLFVLGRKTGSA